MSTKRNFLLYLLYAYHCPCTARAIKQIARVAIQFDEDEDRKIFDPSGNLMWGEPEVADHIKKRLPQHLRDDHEVVDALPIDDIVP